MKLQQQLSELRLTITLSGCLVSTFTTLLVEPALADVKQKRTQTEAVAQDTSISSVSDLALEIPNLVANSAAPITEIPRLSEIDFPLTSAFGLTQQPTKARANPSPVAQVNSQLVPVTAVRLSPTSNGLEVILETADGTSPQVITSSYDQTLLIDVSNAKLALPEGQEFRADNPARGITAVTVTPLSANSVRVTITGEAALPKAQVAQSTNGIVLSLTPSATTATQPTPTPETPEEKPTQPTPETTPEVEPTAPAAQAPKPQPEEELEVVVTGEQEEGYRVPDASTATRTDTPIRDIPQSIQVIPQQVLEDQQVIQLDEALRNVSGVTSGGTSGGAATNFNIRGFSDAPILRDGFREYGDGYQGSAETANLERVEVLKGPASILYGEIQPGGVINLVSKQPLSQPFYEAELQIGSRDLFRPRIDFSGPLTSDGRLLYRLNALFLNEDGFGNFDQNTQDVFIAPVLSWEISDRTDLTVQLESLHSKRPLDDALVAIGEGVANIPFDRNLGEPGDTVEEDFLNVGYNLEHRFSENWTLRNAFRYANRSFLNDGAIPFELDDSTGIQTRYFGLQDTLTENYSLQTNLVGKFATGSISHTLLLGVDLNRSEDKEFTALDFSLPMEIDIFNPTYGLGRRASFDETPIARNYELQTDRLGVYVQDQISLADNFKLLAGVRYDTVDQTNTNKPTAFDPTTSETTQNNDAFTPRVGIVYQPTQALSLYGSYSRSFTPNTSTTANGDLLEPERGEGWEVGVKAELLSSRLFATLAYFDITKQNVATADPNDPFASVATGEQQSRGVELDVTGQILPGWNVILAYAYTDAEVTKDNTIPVGNQLFNSPKHSASLWTTYEIQTGSLQGLGFGIGFNYVGEREGDLENSFQLDSYFLTNAAISYRRNNWRFAINIKNVFDINYIRATNNRRSSGVEPGEPFTVIGSVSMEF
jgi:iron complex outermembrane receptor protein